MRYRFHDSDGTPDVHVTTRADIAARYPGYTDLHAAVGDPDPVLLLADHGNAEAWVIDLPGGSDELFALAHAIDDYAQAMSITEREGGPAGMCACGRALKWGPGGSDYVHADDGTPARPGVHA